MKPVVSIISILSVLLLFSCKKNKTIDYPINGNYGENILTKNNNDSLSSIKNYSLTADLAKKANLKVVVKNQSLSNETWFYTSVDGWSVSEYSNSGIQTFTSTKEGVIDLSLEFIPGPGTYIEGKCQVDIYENSDDVTKSILLNW